MRYIGYVKPVVPINAFSKSIYSDDDGCYYSAVIEGRKIVNFSGIDQSVTIVRCWKETEVQQGEPPIFSYIRENNEPVIGSYYEICSELLGFLNDQNLTEIARLILCSFFKLHGRTHDTIETISRQSVVQIRKENFLPSIELIDDLDLLKDAVANTIAFQTHYSMIHSIKLTDCIYCDLTNTYIQEWKISNDIVAVFIDWEDAESVERRTLLDVMGYYQLNSPAFNDIEEFIGNEGLYIKDTSWLHRLVFIRLMSKDYHLDAANPTSGLAPSIFGYTAENKMHQLTNQNSTISGDKSHIKQMGDKVKEILKKRKYESSQGRK